MTLAETEQSILMNIYNNVIENENGLFPRNPTPTLQSTYNIFSEFREERDNLQQELVRISFALV